MATNINQLEQFAENLASKPSRKSLVKFLRLSPGRDFGDLATYLVARLDPTRHVERAIRIGDTAHETLRHVAESPSRSERHGSLIRQLLFLIEALPLSDSRSAVLTLGDLVQDENYRGWPSKDDDVHRSILLALASQVGRCYKGTRELPAILKRDLHEPAYAVAAMSVLVQHSVHAVAENLPAVLNVLRENHIPATDLLRKIVRQGASEPASWHSLLSDVNKETKTVLENTWAKMHRANSGRTAR